MLSSGFGGLKSASFSSLFLVKAGRMALSRSVCLLSAPKSGCERFIYVEKDPESESLQISIDLPIPNMTPSFVAGGLAARDHHERIQAAKMAADAAAEAKANGEEVVVNVSGEEHEAVTPLFEAPVRPQMVPGDEIEFFTRSMDRSTEEPASKMMARLANSYESQVSRALNKIHPPGKKAGKVAGKKGKRGKKGKKAGKIPLKQRGIIRPPEYLQFPTPRFYDDQGELVDHELPNSEFWERAKTAEIDQVGYKVLVNGPRIDSLTLRHFPIVGAPSIVTGTWAHTRPSDFDYEWFVSTSPFPSLAKLHQHAEYRYGSKEVDNSTTEERLVRTLSDLSDDDVSLEAEMLRVVTGGVKTSRASVANDKHHFDPEDLGLPTSKYANNPTPAAIAAADPNIGLQWELVGTSESFIPTVEHIDRVLCLRVTPKCSERELSGIPVSVIGDSIIRPRALTLPPRRWAERATDPCALKMPACDSSCPCKSVEDGALTIDMISGKVAEISGDILLQTYPCDILPPPEVLTATMDTAQPAHDAAEVPSNGEGDSKSLRVCTYNILAEPYAVSNYARTKMFPHANIGFSFALETPYRVPVILAEVLALRPDILALQEVTPTIFEDFLAALSPYGYEGLFQRKSGQVDEGVATLWNGSTLEAEHAEKVDLGREALKAKASTYLDAGCEGLPITQALVPTSVLKESMHKKAHVGLAVMLRDRRRSSVEGVHPRRILVGNTHLFWDPKFEDVKAYQAACLADRLAELAGSWTLHRGGFPHTENLVGAATLGDGTPMNGAPDAPLKWVHPTTMEGAHGVLQMPYGNQKVKSVFTCGKKRWVEEKMVLAGADRHPATSTASDRSAPVWAGQPVTVMMCGDLNNGMNCGSAVNVLERGVVSSRHYALASNLSRRNGSLAGTATLSQNGGNPQSPTQPPIPALIQPLPFQNAYSEVGLPNAYTTMTPGFVGPLDHIHHTGGTPVISQPPREPLTAPGLKVKRVLREPPAPVIRHLGGFPNPGAGSDHLPMVVDFEWYPVVLPANNEV